MTPSRDPDLEADISRLVEEAVVSGRAPREVCEGRPELLDEVQRRWEHCKSLDAELDALFPALTPADATPATPRNRQPPGDLPQIPGYLTTRILGHGGVGAVYEARHLALKRSVAIKVLLAGAHATPDERARFRREAEVLATLRHPNVVPVYDVGEHDGRPYFAMEHVDGGTLAARLAGAPQPAGWAAEMMRTLAEAVEAAHQAGILHRDLKPSNVLLTVGGTPKISDFGLARQESVGELSAGEITVGPGRVGTPSYMSPEQASGNRAGVGPAADVYSLGAILYEMLTGRPPFRGESASETYRQLLSDEPVPPSRLNRAVPRDLETICLKCLSKDPRRRYGAAAALAEDLRRFRAGEPIAARPAGWAERAAKWVRRYPARASAAAISAALATVLLSGLAWQVSQRAASNRAAAEDLRDAVAAQQRSQWAPAREALGRASLRLGGGGTAELRRQLAATAHDSDVAARLDAIRADRRNSTGGVVLFHQDAEYAALFAAEGLGGQADDPAEVASRIAASHIRAHVATALDDWLLFSLTWHRVEWLLAVSRRLDVDPTGWRQRTRDPALWRDGDALLRATDGVDLAAQPPVFLLALANAAKREGRDMSGLILRVQRAHPDDFWVDLTAGDVMKDRGNTPEAIRFYTAATALRPDAILARSSLAQALQLSGRNEEALGEYAESCRIDPGAVLARLGLGTALSLTGRHAEAISQLERVVASAPDNASARWTLGGALVAAGRDADGVDAFRRAAELGPNDIVIQGRFRDEMVKRGRWADALPAARRANDLAPTAILGTDGYPELCLLAGDEAEYRAASQRQLAALGPAGDPNVCERVGRASLLLPLPPGQLRIATAAIDRAVASETPPRTWARPYFLFAKGLAEYRAGNYASAVAIEEGESSAVLGPAPGLVAAMAHFQLGQRDLALRRFSDASRAFDWSPAKATNRETWIYHVLRREAQAMIQPGPTTTRTTP